MGPPRLRAWLCRAVGERRFLLQVRCSLQPEGRTRRALGRSRNRHRLGRHQSLALAARCRRTATCRREEPADLRANLMRILLTGTSGQVGGALLPLLRQSQEVLAPKRAEFDLSNPNALAATLDRLEVDLIINPAAYTAVDRAEDEPELPSRINAEAPA